MTNNINITTKSISEKHLREWTEKSMVSEEIATLNLESLTAAELNERIKPKNPIKTGGWFCRGVNWRNGQPMGTYYGQGKPDEFHVIDLETEKTAKYMTAAGMEPDAIFLATPDKDYWAKTYADETITRVWAEGVKKAGAGLSIGLATIAVTGVWNWGKDGKLAPEIKRWAQPGTRHIIAFDSDYRDKPSCRQAIIQFGKLLKAAGCEVLVASWSTEWKGMDDYIVSNGKESFKEIIASAETIQQWEKQFKKSKDTDKIPPADSIGLQIAEEYQNRLAFNNEIGQWMRYEADYPGIWSAETDEFLESIVSQIIAAKGIKGYGAHSYIINIVKSMRNQLIERNWLKHSPKHLLPFKNAVLEIATGKLLPHSPSYRFTWRLPREYDPTGGDWSTIDTFLDHLSCNNSAIKELLICYCNAVIKGRHDLQKFLHLIGVGGSGKGTFTRLVTSLIGSENVYTTTLEDWCGNRFEGANAYHKRLVLFPDEDKQTGKLGKFLSLTGEDLIRAEEKGKKAFQYRYDGMVLVVSNLPVFTGDSASRVKRRVITVPCKNAVPVTERRSLEAEFEPELAAFTNYVLSIPDERVTEVLLELKEIPECTLEFWENRVRVDSVAAWLNQHVIYDVMSETPIGCDRNEGNDGMPINTLFGSYSKHCRATGDQPKSQKNFSPDLLEICRSVLGWKVERQVTKTGKSIRGLRLRVDAVDDHLPSYDYALMQLVTGGDDKGDDRGDDTESNSGKALTIGDESSPTLKTNQQFLNQETSSTIYKKIGDDPSPIVKTLVQKDSVSSPLSSPLSSPDKTEQIAVGDEVEYIGTSHRKLKGKNLKVTVIDNPGEVWLKKPDGFPVGPIPAGDLRKY